MPYIGVPPADRTSGARVRDEFTGDGTQTCFQLSQEVPGSFESNIIAVVENVIQEPVESYTIVDTVTIALTSISGTFTKNETVTGGTSSAEGTVVQVNLNNIVVYVTSGTFESAETVTGGSSSASATVSSLTTNVGRGLLFSGAPTSGVAVYVLHQNAATYQLKPAAGSVTPETLSENLRTFTVDKFTATSSQTEFALSTTPVSVKSILVFVDGVMQTETTHYTLSGATLTMGSGLASGQQVTVVHLGFSTVSRTAFPDGSVTTAMIADGATTSDKIATGGVATIDMADGSVTSLKIANGGIAAEDLASDSVTTAKISDANVTADKLASNSVTTAKITDANVTAAKLASGAAVSNIGYTPANKAGDTFTGAVVINSSGNDQFRFTDGTQSMYFDTDSNGVAIAGGPGQTLGGMYIHNSVGNVSLFTNNALRMTVDTSGRVTKPYQPAFHARINNSTYLTTNPLPFSSVVFDVGSNFNTSTYRFTAPIAGKYIFWLNVYCLIPSGTYRNCFLRVNGSSRQYCAMNNPDTSEYITLNTIAIFDLAVNDYVDVSTNGSGGSSYYGGNGETQLYGYLLG